MNRCRASLLLLLALAAGCILAAVGSLRPPPARASPATPGVLVVGDSLEVLTSPYLHHYLPAARLTINVKGGYSSLLIFKLFQEAYDPSQSVIVFDAGTNDNPAYPQILAGRLKAVAAIVGNRCMVVPTIHGLTVNGINSAGKNRVVTAFAASRPGTQVPDWAGAVAAHPEILQPDHLHPNARGAAYRAQLIAQGVNGCLNGGSGLGPPLQPGSVTPPNGPPGARRRRTPKPPPPPPKKKKPRPKPPPPPPVLADASPVLLDKPVTFTSRGARLSGELISPGATGRHPAVVMLQGSGPATREGYREQAEYFAAHGVGALIYDKRGAGDSTGDPDYRYSQLADDARAAVTTLAARPEVDPRAIGLWGFGEGASIGALAAAGNPRVKAVMALSPSAFAPVSQEEWSVRYHLRASGASAGDGAISTFYRVEAGAGSLVSGHGGDLSFDPARAWRGVAQPVLAVWGSQDRAVPTHASAVALESALADGPNGERSFRVIPGASHTLGVAAQGFRLGSAPGFKRLSANWLLVHLREKRPHASVDTPLPAADAVPVRRLADTSPLDRWPVQLAWLLLPAVGLVVLAVAGIRRAWYRDEDEAGAERSEHAAWWLGSVVGLDLLTLGALAYAVASIVEVDGEAVPAVAGVPLAIAVAWALTAAATVATVLLTRRVLVSGAGIRRNPATTVSLASWVWLLLAVYWLI
jgi:dienelactone hydrolase